MFRPGNSAASEYWFCDFGGSCTNVLAIGLPFAFSSETLMPIAESPAFTNPTFERNELSERRPVTYESLPNLAVGSIDWPYVPLPPASGVYVRLVTAGAAAPLHDTSSAPLPLE